MKHKTNISRAAASAFGKKCRSWMTVLAFLSAWVAVPQTGWAAGPWYVDPAGNDSNDCLSPATACLTISAAITKASPADTVNVAAGTYVEAIAITKSLTVRGATADVNKNGYSVPAGYAWDDTVESIIRHPNPNVAYNAVVDIRDTSDVTFEGFVVQELSAVGNNNTSLIRVYANTRQISNIVVRNNVIGPNTHTTLQDGTRGRMGLYIVNNPYSGDYGVIDSTFSGNKIFDAQGNGDNVFIWSSYYAYGAPYPASMSGTVIEDNEIYGSRRSGIESAGGYSDLTIRNNKIYGNRSTVAGAPYSDYLKYGHGIMLIRGASDKLGDAAHAYGPVDLTIQNNEIYGNEKSGIYMGARNTNYLLTGNRIEDNGWNGILLDLEERHWNNTFEPPPVPINKYAIYDGTTNIVVSDNSVAGNGTASVPGNDYAIQVNGAPTNGFLFDASGNWWGTNTPAGVAGAVSANVDYTPWLDAGTDTSVDTGFQGSFSVLDVDDDGPQTGSVGRIQEGIDLESGSTVNVMAGTYSEPLDIEGFAGLTINGADKTTVNIKPTTLACWGLAYGCSRKTAVRVVNSTDVVLQNVTLDLDLVKANSVYGTFYWDSTGTVDNNIIKNLSVSDALGGYYETGCYYRAPGYSAGARANITVSNNTLIDTGRVGILAHDYVNMTITGNTIYKTTADFGYAMEIGSASTATVTGNTIYGHDTPALSDGSNSAGIYVENAVTYDIVSPIAKTVSVAGNEIYDSQWGLYVGNEFDGYAGDVDIALSLTGNDLHDNTGGAAVITDEDRSAGSSVTVTGSGNTLSNNGDLGYLIYTWGDGDVSVDLSGETITDHASTGIYLQDYASGTSGSSYALSVALSDVSGNAGSGVYVNVPDATLGGATLTCNRIVGNGTGIITANSGVTATENTIVGNTTNGVDGSAILSGTMNASDNWWGCASGPGAGCGTVTGSVNPAPWAASPPACVTCNVASDCSNELYCDGTETCSSGSCTAPSGDPCTGGSECADTCNESADNCNDLVGTACTDEGNVCTTNACDGSGTCAATNNTLPCDDNAYCNGADTCGGGSCSVHVGDPCSGGSECANSCNESADNCNDLAGTVCTDDGNGCTTNACDGSGTCAATNNTLPCDDGTYCNGTDTCAAGACTTHAGDPCLAGGECANACNESVDNCYDLAGTTCTDDGNICTTNACNGAGACAATNNTLPCDDGVTCTIADTCTAGTCVGDGPLTGALCSWSMAVRKDAAGGDHIETGVSATVVGDVCASQLVLGTLSSSDSNVVATNATNNATIRIGSGAEISGDIVSGGGGAKGRPAAVKLPYTDVVSLSGGSILAKNDSTGDYDLSGDHPLVAGCTSAQNGYAGAVSAVAALGSDMSLPPIVLNAGETATVLAPHPGAVNVIDVEDVRGKSNTTLELDAGGNADTTIVLRIAGSLHMASGSSIALVGGLTADRVLIRVLGRKCDLGNNFLGAGTLLCPNARIQVDYDGIWTGSLFAGKKVLRVGDRVELNYSPFLAF